MADAASDRVYGFRGACPGFLLYVEGEVLERDPPRLKAWHTIGEPRLLVIGRYGMSVAIGAHGFRRADDGRKRVKRVEHERARASPRT